MLTPEAMSELGTESAHQKALFQWAALNREKWPELEWMFAIPNGGKRSPMTAARMKAEGAKAGVPDLFLPARRDGYGGFFIEMKRGEVGRLSKDQLKWIQSLMAAGYMVRTCYSWEEAAKCIEEYLGRGKR